MLLRRFEDWASEWIAIQKGIGYQVELKEPPEDSYGKSIVLNLDSPDVLSQIIVWEYGLCIVHVIDVNSGKILLMETHHLSESADFANIFQEFLRLTGCIQDNGCEQDEPR